MNIKEDDIVMCTVKKIEGTTVFLRIEGDGDGSVAFPEIAAGRIRNIRDYVVPNKKIVCKVLRIINGHPQLSLRRVTAKERDECKEKYDKEKTLFGMLKNIVKNPAEIIEKIKSAQTIPEFLEQAKENPKSAEKFISKAEAQTLAKILSEKREKEKIAKKKIILRSDAPNGIEKVKEILNIKDMQIHYLGSSQFMIEASGKDFKEINTRVLNALKEIEKRAKERKAFFELKE